MLSWLYNRIPHPVRATEDRIKETIMATRDELLTELDSMKNQVVKVRGEFVDRITSLEEKLVAAQPITLEDLAALKSEIQVSDDVNPDTVVEPAPVEPAPEPEVPAVEDTVTTAEPTA